ncbi:MAG: methionyl-tRNA formyltransferase [Opitutales bacterium]
MGSDAIALPLLNFLFDDEQARAKIAFAGVITQPDRPSGRGKKRKANEIKNWAIKRGIEVRQPEKPGKSEVGFVAFKEIHLVLVMAYGHILRPSLLEAPPAGTFNLHTSLLPAFRGASPMQGALAAGESRTGVTLMKMAPRMDAGPVVDVEEVAIDRLETALSLEAKLAEACVPLVRRNLDSLIDGTAPLREQDEAAATYTRKLEKRDGLLDFSTSARSLARRINALYPWPGAMFSFGDLWIKIGLADWLDEPAGAAPGTVLEASPDGLKIAAAEGVLVLLKLQRPGGRLLPVGDFLRGLSIPAGTRLPSFPMPELVHEATKN